MGGKANTLAVTELTVSHFRSHTLSRLEFDGRPVTIHGPNGAGKTNLLEAISLLSPGRGLRRASIDDMARRPQSVGWKVSASLISLAHAHEIETWAEPGTARQTRIDNKAAPQAALGRIARILWLVPSMDRLWTEGADGRRRFLDRMTLSFDPGHGEAVLAYEKAMRERNRLLKDQVRDAAWYGALEDQMATSGAAITRNRASAVARIAEMQRLAETAFPVADLSLLAPDGVAIPDDREALADVLAQGRAGDLLAGRTLNGPHRADLGAIYATKGVPARDCSTGEQKALLISLILANARALALDFGAPPILLLDEIAAHLDGDRRVALYEEICAIRAQAFMTGTSADLFDGFGDRAQYLEVTEKNGNSTVSEGSRP